MSRRLRYGVAVSLDGFIAGPHGEYGWIIMDPSIDFGAMFKQFDTAVMGRKTFEVVRSQGGEGTMPGVDVVVFSKTLSASERRGVRVTNRRPEEVVAELKAQPGRDICLFGGGELCRSLLDAGLVDTFEVAVIPVVLGSGIPLVAPGPPANLVLSDHKVLPKTGIVMLSYAVKGGVGPPPRIGFIKPGRRAKKAKAAKTAKRTRERPTKVNRRSRR